MTSILNFRIFNVTSQDHEYPAQDLVSLISNTKLNGWQSQRFWTYPQELILQFDNVVHLTQVQFLIHEKKIPSMIELFIWIPRNEALMSSIKYERLGHFTLNDNTVNNYKSRELKSVFLDHYWKYLKICFDKPYFNKYNPFNQVGVVRIVCHGSVNIDYFKYNSLDMGLQANPLPSQLPDGEYDNIQQPEQSTQDANNQMMDEIEDPMILDKLEMLNKK